MTSNNPMRSRGNKSSSFNDSDNNNNNMYNNNRYGDVEGGRNRSAGGRGFNDANSNIMEQQNNERIDLLSDQVARLKGLTIEIGNEVKEQNSLLDNMGDAFSNTRDLLGNSLTRIGTMLQSGGAKHMCYMVAFGVGVLIFVWWLMHWKA
ncbi:hypothetical protein MPSEU_001024900 [Mayamaea pseudoterrestris]|nr:hypothetical protein MPSEU_001024900 [Mayamaea pseudoterrestris]